MVVKLECFSDLLGRIIESESLIPGTEKRILTNHGLPVDQSGTSLQMFTVTLVVLQCNSYRCCKM